MSNKETIKEKDVEDTIPLPPTRAPHIPEAEIPTFSDYLLNDLFSSPSEDQEKSQSSGSC